MRRRRAVEEEQENHERWLVSYADFITLLFAFFVVMYALSSINEGKYRILSDALSAAFHTVPGNSVGMMVAVGANAPLPVAAPIAPVKLKTPIDEQRKKRAERLRNIARELAEALAPLVRDGQVRISEGALGVTIDINANILFAPGDARLDGGAIRTLFAVGQILAPTEFPINVGGHTDNTPINTAQFPSNWELSGMRASSVVRLLIDSGVDPQRLTATGYADRRPVAENATPDGRQRNRRVAILIESIADDPPPEPRPGVAAAHLSVPGRRA